MVHQAEFLDAHLQNCCSLRRFVFPGVLHINSDEARIQAAALHPEPTHHLVGLVWFAGADDLQRLLAVELNPFERSGLVALLAGDVNVDEVAPLVRRLGMMTLGGRFLRHGLPPVTVGFGERSFWFVCNGNGSGNGGLWERGRDGRQWGIFAVRRRWCVGGGSSGTWVYWLWGSPFAVPCGNRSVGGAGGGVEELTVQIKWFLLLN